MTKRAKLLKAYKFTDKTSSIEPHIGIGLNKDDAFEYFAGKVAAEKSPFNPSLPMEEKMRLLAEEDAIRASIQSRSSDFTATLYRPRYGRSYQ